MRLLSFPTILQYSIICQSNFFFIQHSIIWEKQLTYYIFALPEVNKMFLQNYYPSKWLYHSKRTYNFSLGSRVFKVLRTQKKELATVQKEYTIDQLVTFPLSRQSCYISLLKWEEFVLHRKSFLKDLLRHGKDENKTGEVWLL